MSRRMSVLLLTALLWALVAPAASADLKPTDVPHQVMPGEAGFAAAFGAVGFTDLWEELDGVGAELPQTGHFLGPINFPVPVYNPSFDDFVRGPVPIGFDFHYMNGPVEPAPGWPPADWDGRDIGEPPPPLPPDWPAALSDMGYQEVYVSTNGFLVFADDSLPGLRKTAEFKISAAATWQQPGLGAWNWWPTELPIREPPNNFVAPYWTDLAIGDNSYHKVAELCDLCVKWDYPPGAPAICMEWEKIPCEWELVERPRGKLLYATLGEAPNRKFVVEWLNARNHWTGFLATFQVQLFEGSNAILFLYKDFVTKEPGQAYFDSPSVVIGMEDWFGTTGVGQAFTLGVPASVLPPGISWREIAIGPISPHWPFKVVWDATGSQIGSGEWLPPPKGAGDMVGFVY